MQQLKTILLFTKTFIKRNSRDKIAMFFYFLFPLIFLFVFGTIFSNQEVSFKAALINDSETAFAQDFVKKAFQDDKIFKFNKDIKTLDQAKEAMNRNKISVTFALGNDFGTITDQKGPTGKIITYYEKNNEQTATAAMSIMESILTEINQFMGHPSPPLTIEGKMLEKASASNFDHIYSGLVGFSLIGAALFGLSMGIPGDKKTGALKRLRASSLKPMPLILAYGFMTVFFSLLSFGLMSIIAVFCFGLNMRGSWLITIILCGLGSFMLAGLGTLVGGWAKNEDQASPAANLIAFPLMFLSGTFFPRFIMPEWLQNVTEFSPLTPIIDGIRKTVTENVGIIELAPQFSIILVWIVIFYFIAPKVFRWE